MKAGRDFFKFPPPLLPITKQVSGKTMARVLLDLAVSHPDVVAEKVRKINAYSLGEFKRLRKNIEYEYGKIARQRFDGECLKVGIPATGHTPSHMGG